MSRWLLPWGLALPCWLVFLRALRRGERQKAFAVAAVWAFFLAVLLAFTERREPGTCAQVFFGAEGYAHSMLTWVQTGVGCEGDPRCFIGQHATHLALFSLLTLATAGLGGLALGALLLGWMGAYASALAQHTGSIFAFVLAWHPWAILRVTGFLILGVTLSEPLARWDLPSHKGSSRWLFKGLAFCAADLALKWLLAEWWRTHVLQTLWKGLAINQTFV